MGGYVRWILAVVNIWGQHQWREGLHRDLEFLYMTQGGSPGAAEMLAPPGSSLVNLLLHCIIFMTIVLDSEEGRGA